MNELKKLVEKWRESAKRREVGAHPCARFEAILLHNLADELEAALAAEKVGGEQVRHPRCSKCGDWLCVYIADRERVKVWWCGTCNGTKCAGTGEITMNALLSPSAPTPPCEHVYSGKKCIWCDAAEPASPAPTPETPAQGWEDSVAKFMEGPAIAGKLR